MSHFEYKVAAVQAAPAFLDRAKSVDKVIAYMKEVAAEGCKLVAFPECFVPGYPYWIWLQSPAHAINEGFVNKYYDNALVYGSPDAIRIQDAAKELDICVVLGLTEKIGSTLFIAQWIVGPDGEIIRRRRKLRPTHCERWVFGEGDGSDIGVDEIPGLGRIGALSCWENILSLNRYTLCAHGEQVHIAAWPGFAWYNDMADSYQGGCDGKVNCAVTQALACENGVYTLSPFQLVNQEMVDILCEGDKERLKLIAPGGAFSHIYGPDGGIIAKMEDSTAEGVLYATVDSRKIDLARSVLDPVGHYSRPDVYRVFFNNRRQERISLTESGWEDETVLMAQQK